MLIKYVKPRMYRVMIVVFPWNIRDEDEEGANSLNFKDTIQLCDIVDLFELCKNQCNLRYLSVLIYLILLHFNISYQETHNLTNCLQKKGEFSTIIREKKKMDT